VARWGALETHAPTIGGTSLRVLLAVAAQRKLIISKLDVESAFLIDYVDEGIYVQIPRDYTDHVGTSLEVWKLARSLYGLRQAPRLFWLGMREALVAQGFKSSDHDPFRLGLFIRLVEDGTYTYVDGCAVVSNSLERSRWVRERLLKKYWGIKWENAAETFVGLALRRTPDGSLLVAQPAYTRHVLDFLQVERDGVTFSPTGVAGLVRGWGKSRRIYLWFRGCERRLGWCRS